MPKTLAAATVDRLLHHAHVLITDGTESYRLAQATSGRGGEAPGGLKRPRDHDSAPAYGLRYVEIANPQGRGEPMATSGEKTWPPPGRTDGRPWGEPDGR